MSDVDVCPRCEEVVDLEDHPDIVCESAQRRDPHCGNCEWWHGKGNEWGDCYLALMAREYPRMTSNWIKLRLTGHADTLETHREFVCRNWERTGCMESFREATVHLPRGPHWRLCADHTRPAGAGEGAES